MGNTILSLSIVAGIAALALTAFAGAEGHSTHAARSPAPITTSAIR